MLSLAELQHRFAQALLDDPGRLPRELFARGPIPVEAALRVHLNTVLGALANSLSLTFPTVAALVGEAFFDQAAGAYAADYPPIEARLSAYGGDFPAFLQALPQAAGLAYLPDVARLDLAIARAAAAPRFDRLIDIDPAVALSAPVSLEVLELLHPADLIRDAIEAGDDAALAGLDLSPRPRRLAVWRAEAGAGVQPLSPPAGLFLAALIAGAEPEYALAEAAALAGQAPALLAIQSEVFAAPFAAIVPKAPQP